MLTLTSLLAALLIVALVFAFLTAPAYVLAEMAQEKAYAHQCASESARADDALFLHETRHEGFWAPLANTMDHASAVSRVLAGRFDVLVANKVAAIRENRRSIIAHAVNQRVVDARRDSEHEMATVQIGAQDTADEMMDVLRITFANLSKTHQQNVVLEVFLASGTQGVAGLVASVSDFGFDATRAQIRNACRRLTTSGALRKVPGGFERA